MPRHEETIWRNTNLDVKKLKYNEVEAYINPKRGGIERTDHPTSPFVLRAPSLSFRYFLLYL
uniref:Protein Wnt n=1 Tax=Heterorhabditis bacteriophora TaxID=37862 RepID=A0A1I7W6K4_HETBA